MLGCQDENLPNTEQIDTKYVYTENMSLNYNYEQIVECFKILDRDKSQRKLPQPWWKTVDSPFKIQDSDPDLLIFRLSSHYQVMICPNRIIMHLRIAS